MSISPDDYIAGKSFANISKWVVCNRYKNFFISENVEHGDIVFLNLDLFAQFIQHINQHKPKNKFILITANSDQSFTYQHYYLIKDFVIKIYAGNNITEHDDVITTPMGFRDFPFETRIELSHVNNINVDKSILIYMNFVINTNVEKRKKCYDTFTNCSWVTQNSGLALKDFYIELKKSKYALSPEGTGIDCHRIYECMYYDTIPILKRSRMDNFYKKLPVIIVNEWEEITEEFLLKNYDTYYNNLIQWKNENKNWLHPHFWIKV
jgi:hypothetical protein